jgi:DHA1 family bicyclomycin/chloramphenicol resistance-like MFS transporter
MLQRVVGEIGLKYGLDHTSLGLIITMTYLGFTISPILAGETTDRFGRRPVVMFAFVCMLVGFALAYFVHSAWGVGAGFLVSGLAFGMFEMTMSSILADIDPANAGKVLNYSRLCYALGTIAGPFIAMGLLERFNDWAAVMALDIVLLLALFLLFLRLSYPAPVYPNRIEKPEERQPVTFRMLKNWVLLVLSLSLMMYFAVEAGLTFYVSQYIGTITQNTLHMTLALSVFWLFAAAGRLIAAQIRIDAHVLIGVLTLLIGLGLALCLSTNNLVLSILSFGLMGLGCSAVYPTMLAAASRNFPHFTATVFGIMISIGGLGGILQPLVMGAVADVSTGMKPALAVCIVPLVIVVALNIVLWVNDRRKEKTKQTEQ